MPGWSSASRWRTLAATDPAGGGPFALLLTAMEAANRGDYRTALLTSEPALAFDSAGAAPDPFFRASLHLLRGRWQDEAKLPDDADRSWLWYENTDAVGWPQREAQPPHAAYCSARLPIEAWWVRSSCSGVTAI